MCPNLGRRFGVSGLRALVTLACAHRWIGPKYERQVQQHRAASADLVARGTVLEARCLLQLIVRDFPIQPIAQSTRQRDFRWPDQIRLCGVCAGTKADWSEARHQEPRE